jgi:tetratricopeptide (TPR) repeat protein
MSMNNAAPVGQDARSVMAGITQALSQTDEEAQGALYLRLGEAALVAGDARTQALDAFTRARTLAIAHHDRRLEALALNGLSGAHDTLGRRHQALAEAQEAEQIARELDDRRLLALTLNSQAQFYKENGQNPQAGALFQQVFAIGHALADEELVMGGLIGLGRTTPMSEPDRAMDYYTQAIAIAERRGDTLALSLCYNNLADWKINTGAYAEAIALREESLHLSRQLGDREGMGRALIGIGKAYTLLGDYAHAREYLDQGLPVIVRSGDLEGELHSYLNLAHLYARAGDVPRACEYYGSVLEKSLAAPDAACALFAQEALDQLAEGILPRPAILPAPGLPSTTSQPVSALGGTLTYPTGDQRWGR